MKKERPEKERRKDHEDQTGKREKRGRSTPGESEGREPEKEKLCLRSAPVSP